MSDEKKSGKLKYIIGAVVVLAVIGNLGDGDKNNESASSAEGDSSASASGSDSATPEKKAQKPATKIGDKVTFDNAEWVVLEAKTRGNKLKSNNQFQEAKTTSGYFVEIKFQVTNTAKEEDRIMGGLSVRDSKGREFKEMDGQTFYLPKNSKTMGLEALPASMPKEFQAMFEVPPDAADLVFLTRSLGFSPDLTPVDLGLANPEAPAGGTAPAAEKGQNANSGKVFNIGDAVTFDDSQWKVLKAEHKGSKLRANNSFQKAAKTTGAFVRVKMQITNNTPKEERIAGGIFLVDSVGRSFGTISQQAFYIPKKSESVGLEALPASMPKEFWAVFEVAADAHDLKFQARSLSMLSDHALVDLKLSNPKTPAPAANAKRLGSYTSGKDYSVGTVISFDDSDWKVLEGKDKGQKLKASGGYGDPLTTLGKYIQVKFEVTNRSKSPESIMGGLLILDSRDREFKTVDMQSLYLPKRANAMSMAKLQPDMPRTFHAIFEVPPDATGMRFVTRDLGIIHDKAPVALGL